MVMEKEKALQNCLWAVKEYGYISEDGVLDVCDENMELVRFCMSELNKMVENGRLTSEQWGLG